MSSLFTHFLCYFNNCATICHANEDRFVAFIGQENTVANKCRIAIIPRRATAPLPSSFVGMSDEENPLQATAGRIVRGLAYTTSKFTRIKDWRLAVFFYFCQLAVLVGIVASLILGKTFLALEVPVGVLSSYAYGDADFTDFQASTSAGNITAPCGDLVRTQSNGAIRGHTIPHFRDGFQGFSRCCLFFSRLRFTLLTSLPLPADTNSPSTRSSTPTRSRTTRLCVRT